MSLQNELNQIVAFMRKQGKPAMGPPRDDGKAPVCKYRAEDGSKCAVGCRISDEFLAKYGREGASFASFQPRGLEELARKVEIEEGTLTFFYSRMQQAHDYAVFDQTDVDDPPPEINNEEWLANFENRARKVAEEFKLEYPET